MSAVSVYSKVSLLQRFLFFVVVSFSFQLHARPSETALLDELRLELSDVKHDLHSARVEIALLEEKIAKQEGSKKQAPTLNPVPLDALEKRISQLEKCFEKAATDLRALNVQASSALNKIQNLEASLSSQEKKFEEIFKLKTTLSSISKAIGQKNDPSLKTYSVKAGDSLEKIAKSHHTTVEEIKQLNCLSNDKIVIGQILKIGSDEKK